MMQFDEPDSHRLDRMAAVDELARIKAAIIQVIREKWRPIRAKEVPGFGMAAIGRCVDKNKKTFIRLYGYSVRGESNPSYIGLHRDMAAFEPNYHDCGHIVEIKK